MSCAVRFAIGFRVPCAALAFSCAYACTSSGPPASSNRGAPRDSGFVVDAPNIFIRNESDARTGTTQTYCHILRYSPSDAGAMSCELAVSEPIQNPAYIQVSLPRDGGGLVTRRATVDDCAAGGWYWAASDGGRGTVTLCDETCRAVRSARPDFMDIRIYCPPGNPFR